MKKVILIIGLFFGCFAFAEIIGDVDTEWNLIGKNDKLIIEAFDDPLVSGVSCYVSRPVIGGIKGGIGIAEETSDSSLSCRQIGPITEKDIENLNAFEKKAQKKEGKDRVNYRSVFKKHTNLFFKHTWVVRFYDSKRNVIVYMSFAREWISGSPKSSVSVVPIMQ